MRRHPLRVNAIHIVDTVGRQDRPCKYDRTIYKDTFVPRYRNSFFFLRRPPEGDFASTDFIISVFM